MATNQTCGNLTGKGGPKRSPLRGYFINHGASVGIVNSEGEVPSDLAEEPAVKDLLLEHVRKQGVDLEQSRKEEEQQMLQDARQWLNRGKIEDVRQPRSGATALHVAAAKGYSEVLRLLIQAGYELNVQDHDGWTPLHAAAHWGVREACSILAEALCDMDARNKLGQTPFDVADEGLVGHLETLQKKQSVLRSEKETRNKLIESDLNSKLQSGLFKNKEKILYEEETPKSRETEEEGKESSSSSSEEEGEDQASESETEKEAGDTETLHPPSAGGHCSSEERSLSLDSLMNFTCDVPCGEAASHTCGSWRGVYQGRSSNKKPDAIISHSSSESRSSVSEQTPASAQSAFSASAARRVSTGLSSLFPKPEAPRDESPSSWRLGLRKTGSHNMLSEAASSRDALRDRGPSVHRSASSPRVSALLDNRDKERENRSHFSSLAPRRLSGTRDPEGKENRELAANLVRSGPCARQAWRDETEGNEAPWTAASPSCVSAYLRRAPYKPRADTAAEKTADGVPLSTPLCVITNRPPPSSASGVTAATLLPAPGTDSSAEARERRRSYLTPVRDEEAESLRKARSRQARQTRRSTQGVTLTDLQEAERTLSQSRAERQAPEPPGPKPTVPGGLENSAQEQEAAEGPQPWGRGLDAEPVCRRLRCPAQPDKPTTPASSSEARPSLCTGSPLLRMSRPSDPGPGSSEMTADGATAKERDRNEGEEAELDDASSHRLTVRERRRPRERRRGTGINFWTQDEDGADVSDEVKAMWHERLSRLESGGSNPAASDSYGDRASARARREAREARLATLTSRVEEDGHRDYRKLYEGALTENQKLKAKLQEAQLELADVRCKLEKVAQQKQEKTSDRTSVLETEKRERRALERKMSEMEEEMKVPPLLDGLPEVHGVHGHLHLPDDVVFGEAVKVVDGHHQGLAPQLLQHFLQMQKQQVRSRRPTTTTTAMRAQGGTARGRQRQAADRSPQRPGRGRGPTHVLPSPRTGWRAGHTPGGPPLCTALVAAACTPGSAGTLAGWVGPCPPWPRVRRQAPSAPAGFGDGPEAPSPSGLAPWSGPRTRPGQKSRKQGAFMFYCPKYSGFRVWLET
ncbi:protein phosphatase 1 regulatory subunit 12B isoform X6 [Camelus bactrianus]|uniref:Protein phosphatase 1 regulatory subunit 12B isoform X6 n=1 Tax=Camelus bactrianus TaxID=9837 RepID=A0AC58PC10_CAMBA